MLTCWPGEQRQPPLLHYTWTFSPGRLTEAELVVVSHTLVVLLAVIIVNTYKAVVSFYVAECFASQASVFHFICEFNDLSVTFNCVDIVKYLPLTLKLGYPPSFFFLMASLCC